ncbi:MAG: cyclic pyranopterin monophosphate synthase MoaC [Planctomycetes bacterium]|nr:cyclic pyranopterin monophosphate synthase MoaC [Planctomycetota bacterium]
MAGFEALRGAPRRIRLLGAATGHGGRRPTLIGCGTPNAGKNARKDFGDGVGELTHFDDAGASRMVDVGGKSVSRRRAKATARVRMSESTLARIRDRSLEKGDVLEVARLAGIQGAKRTPDLIPLCHPLPIEFARVGFEFIGADTLRIEAEVGLEGKTGVEMEALTAVAVAALAVYDMCKSIDRSMTIESVRLEEKSGGRSGVFRREDT